MGDCLELEKRKIGCKFLSLRDRTELTLTATYDDNIFAKVKELSVYKKAKTVMFYLSYNSEVATNFMVKSAIKEGKVVVVPAIKNPRDKQMQAVRISKLENAHRLVYGIRQPEISCEDIIKKNDIDLIFIPGIVFDVLGYRIGYGKGYYDRWLKGVRFNKTVGLAYDFQIINKIPTGKYDLPVSIIITEKRVIQVMKN